MPFPCFVRIKLRKSIFIQIILFFKVLSKIILTWFKANLWSFESSTFLIFYSNLFFVSLIFLSFPLSSSFSKVIWETDLSIDILLETITSNIILKLGTKYETKMSKQNSEKKKVGSLLRKYTECYNMKMIFNMICIFISSVAKWYRKTERCSSRERHKTRGIKASREREWERKKVNNPIKGWSLPRPIQSKWCFNKSNRARRRCLFKLTFDNIWNLVKSTFESDSLWSNCDVSRNM